METTRFTKRYEVKKMFLDAHCRILKEKILDILKDEQDPYVKTTVHLAVIADLCRKHSDSQGCFEDFIKALRKELEYDKAEFE